MVRIKSIFAALAALLALVVAVPEQASAGFGHHHRDGWGTKRVVRHFVYYPHYHHHYATHSVTDPYAYRYEPRGYYPYYNSQYWVPARCYKRCFKRYKLPPYYQAWGSRKRGYHHAKWHKRHHKGHRRYHW